MMTQAEVTRRLKDSLERMADWQDGRCSWTNFGPHEPYTPEAIAVMDAQEVVKHSAAAQAYAAVLAALWQPKFS